MTSPLVIGGSWGVGWTTADGPPPPPEGMSRELSKVFPDLHAFEGDTK